MAAGVAGLAAGFILHSPVTGVATAVGVFFLMTVLRIGRGG